MKNIFLILAFLCSTSYASTKYVYNVTKDEIIVDNNSEIVRPIASVTKLMTAIVSLNEGGSLDKKIPYHGFLGFGKRTKQELLYLLLVKSDNQAAEALAKSYPGGRDNFIISMNIHAYQFGMLNTHYADPSGLNVNNKSTAKDLSLLLQRAYIYPQIREMASSTTYSVMKPVKKKNKVVKINNTNIILLKEYNQIQISKTGFTNPAGKCLVMYLTKNNEQYIIVILGERNTKSVQQVGRGIIESL
jgi:D-alanyl-D-alanine endopeptidase (penicillin-binding protein 7)